MNQEPHEPCYICGDPRKKDPVTGEMSHVKSLPWCPIRTGYWPAIEEKPKLEAEDPDYERDKDVSVLRIKWPGNQLMTIKEMPMPEEPLKVTPEELADDLLVTFKRIARYWARLPEVDPCSGREYTVEDRCDGVVFSILAQLDGCGGLPAFDLVSHVHPDDEDQSMEGVTISAMLHERYGSVP